MKNVDWKTIVEFTGIAGILVGLYFVFAELRQEGTVARADLNVGVMNLAEGVQSRFDDPAFTAMYLKGLEAVDDLSAVERRQLSAFYNSIAQIFVYEWHNYTLGLFPEYENLPRILTRRYMTGEYGRAWWAVNKVHMPNDIVVLVDDELSKYSGIVFDLQSDLELLEQVN
jgi:hypothetical protein